jgi:hypothetical protein
MAFTAEEKKERKREYDRKWYVANREREREKHRKYAAEHREQNRERSRQWCAEHPERNREHRRKYYAENSELERERRREYYAKNSERSHESYRKYYLQNQAIMIIAKGNICWDCGEEFISRQLNFHHRDPSTKVKVVPQMVMHSEVNLRAEIAKCDVLCQGCHTAAHQELALRL